MVAITKLDKEQEEVFPFHFCAIIPCEGKEEAISYDVTAHFSKERIAKLVAAFNIITDQRPGAVTIEGANDSMEFFHKSTKS